ncbi:hypothetical protein B0H10DRAFT_1967076 [Mycena sp. CBHHK59/15]|nr:hypothetical protein B0H10DRAFT_1967076 [Mycena sp. CBHHK59/15]
MDPMLLNVVRYELDPASRDAVLAAQAETHPSEGLRKLSACEVSRNRLHGNRCKGAPMMNLYLNGLTKLLPERYIHSYITNPDGKGEMNEWELTIFAKVVLHAASVIRAYINRASADFFEQPMPLKRFVSGGNLLFMNADMDTAQIIGICRSIMKHNVPEYSGIPNDTPPEKVALESLKSVGDIRKSNVANFSVNSTQLMVLSSSGLFTTSGRLYPRPITPPPQFRAHRLKGDPRFVFGLRPRSKCQENARLVGAERDTRVDYSVSRQVAVLNPAEVWDNTPSTTNTNEAQPSGLTLFWYQLLLVEGLERPPCTPVGSPQRSRPSYGLQFPMQSNTAQKARDSREQTEERKQLEGQLAEQLEGIANRVHVRRISMSG